MNTSQLQCCIDCDPLLKQYVLGVFSADRLPQTYYPCAFIANTDDYSQRGEHWCAFYSDKPGSAEFFDSYGNPPGYYNDRFKTWLNRRTSSAVFNGLRIQSDFSSVCGLYCLFYLRQKLTGHTMQEIANVFNSTDLGANDRFIYEYTMRVFPHCIANDCVYKQICNPLIHTVMQ